MHIVINTACQRFGGAVQVALSFIEECRAFPHHDFHVWVGPGLQGILREGEFPPNFHFTHFNFGAVGISKLIPIQDKLSAAERRASADVIITTTGPSYFRSRAPQILGFNLPLYIYPESPHLKRLSWRRRMKFRAKKAIQTYFLKRDAAAFFVQTGDANSRVRSLMGTDEVYTVSNTCHSGFTRPLQGPAQLPPRRPAEWRLLTVSAYYPHKDLEIIPRVADELRARGRTNVQFVVTLKPRDWERLPEPADRGSVINVGPVPPQDCPALYGECDALFLPTLAECFSASYPEAMAMGKPIVTTSLGFARSICRDAALYFAPSDPKAAADAIEELISDRTLQVQLVEAGRRQLATFDTAQERARKYLELCERYGRPWGGGAAPAR